MSNHKLPTINDELLTVNRKPSKVVLQVDKESLSRAIGRLEQYRALPRKFRPALGEVADYVRTQMITSTFEKEGPGWRPLAKRTQMERRMQGYGAQHPILKRTGDLFKELTSKSHPKHVEVIRVGKNARIEIGGSSTKFMENQLGVRSQRLPSRPMIPGSGGMDISDRDRIAINEIIKRAIVRKR